MSISITVLVAMAVLYSCGVYLLLERSMTRVLLGFLMLGNATNLLILLMAGGAGAPPIVGEDVPAAMTDPLPQALILTSIVITFSVSAFLMALIYRSWRLAKEDDLERDAEDIAVAQRAVALAAEESDETSEGSEFDTGALSTGAIGKLSSTRDQEEVDETAAAQAADSAAYGLGVEPDADAGGSRRGDE